MATDRACLLWLGLTLISACADVTQATGGSNDGSTGGTTMVATTSVTTATTANTADGTSDGTAGGTTSGVDSTGNNTTGSATSTTTSGDGSTSDASSSDSGSTGGSASGSSSSSDGGTTSGSSSSSDGDTTSGSSSSSDGGTTSGSSSSSDGGTSSETGGGDPCAAGSPAVLPVTALNASSYQINGADNPVLTVVRGCSYQFQINAPGHPFYIKTIQGAGVGNAYTDGVAGNGTVIGNLDWDVSDLAPDTLFYNCSIHEAMSNQIDVIDPP